MATTPQPLSGSLSLPLHTSFQSSSALWWPCPANKRPKVFLLFIPGNPGLSSYYIPYLDAIHSSEGLEGQVEILAVSHRGHSKLPASAEAAAWEEAKQSKGPAAKGTGTTLHDQIEQKVDAVKAIRQLYPEGPEDPQRVKLVLVGHSVGAYISLRVLERLGDQVDGVQLLFPTVIHIARTPKARSLPLQLVTSPLAQALVLPLPLFILSLLPTLLLATILRLLTGLDARAGSPGLSSTLDLITTPRALLSAAQMASDEFRLIRGLDPKIRQAVSALEARGGTCRAYWSRGDDDAWAPAASRRDLEKELGLSRVGVPPDVALPLVAADGSAEGSGRRSRASLLRSRTLQIGGTLTRAAGRKLAGAARRTGGQGHRKSGSKGGSIGGSSSYAQVAAKEMPATPTKSGGGGRPTSSGNGAGKSTALEDLFSATGTKEAHASSYVTSPGSVTSPTQQRQRIIPLTPSSPQTSLKGPILASSPQQERHNPTMAGGANPEDEALKQRRMSSLSRARARRSIDGTITLELPKGQDWSFLANAAAAANDGAGSAIEESDGDATDVESVKAVGKLSAALSLGVGKESEGPRATSTVCKVGMPHAFCLRHGVEMGRISSWWVQRDFLPLAEVKQEEGEK
ncbi:hypothetical protein BDZ90DRAFT_232702 [Jaminaea rosea]|uniref:Uncharacterized protein n=1 Tax=Jaminaea rosea TaxID=1569628 RepID=A0A316UPC0_9BASI|nr:hypothetical protein BDZ90DRAFT_232702 [Jaminaea rosea]PWN27146.1 hypothetical protein BDZ90DRAFT_232702 [Jaminaea rosea]